MIEPTSLALIVKVAGARVLMRRCLMRWFLMRGFLVAVITVPMILVPVILVLVLVIESVILMAAAMAVVAKVVTIMFCNGADAVSGTVQGDPGKGDTQELGEEEEPCQIHGRRLVYL